MFHMERHCRNIIIIIIFIVIIIEVLSTKNFNIKKNDMITLTLQIHVHSRCTADLVC